MPTRLGVGVFAAGACCLVGGYLLGYSQLDVLGCAALLAVAVALATIAWRPAPVLARELSSAYVRRGEPAECVLTVRNTRRLPQPPVRVRDRLGEQRVLVPVPFLRPGRDVTVTYRMDTAHRGVFEVGPLRWERRDPLGLAAAGRPAGAPQCLHVHPAVHPMAVLPSGRARNPEGPAADVVTASGLTFHRLRDYVAGDDLRQIHWRSSARTGTLMVRENVDTSLPSTTVLLDSDDGGYDGAGCFEEAVDVAASALAAAVSAGSPARCMVGETSVEVRGGLRSVLDQLAGVRLGAGPGLRGLIHRLPNRPAGATLIAICGQVDDADLAALRQVAPRYDRTALVVLHAPDTVAFGTAAGGLLVLTAVTAGEACARWNALVGSRR